MNYRERLKDKKRIVIKIGSSSLTHSQTGRINLRKLEVLVREICDLQNQNYRERLKDKKRIVIKIGSSSLTHSQTGRINLRKLEVLVREICDLQNQ